MADIKSEFVIDRGLDLVQKTALAESASVVILQDVVNPAELINETGHAGVGRPHHGTPCLDTAENGMSQMLAGSGRMQKPAVVGHIDQEVGAGIAVYRKNEMPHELADG